MSKKFTRPKLGAWLARIYLWAFLLLLIAPFVFFEMVFAMIIDEYIPGFLGAWRDIGGLK